MRAVSKVLDTICHLVAILCTKLNIFFLFSIEGTIWCWYCNRRFEDENILIKHQQAKHFKCQVCQKRLYSGPGLLIHCKRMHFLTIDKVPNAHSNRNNIEVEITGMEGIPHPDEDLTNYKNPRIR